MQKIPRGVWVLGFVSLFMDLSSEMAHGVLPLFLVGTLGASATVLGLLEAAAVGTSHFSKLWSGVLSDRWQSRKGLALLGYGMAAIVKPLFPLAETVLAVFVARVTDRIGKGIRGAPRDAMVADFTPPEMRGAAYGLRQALDSVGAFAEPSIAVLLIGVLAMDIRTVLWVACIPALIAVLLLAAGVNEPSRKLPASSQRASFKLQTFRFLGSAFWRVAAIVACIMLARISDAFLILRASSLGLSIVFVPLVLVLLNAVDALSSYPSGALSDRWGRKPLLLAGLVTLLIANLVLALQGGVASVVIGVTLWGLHMGLTQGVLSSLVADAAPEDLRGSAFGMFSFVSGVATVLGSAGAGIVWDLAGGGPVVFACGAVVCLVGLGLSALPAAYKTSSRQ